MTFEEIVDQAIAMLQRRGRVTYRVLQRQFALDDAALADLKEEVLFSYPQVTEEDGRGLVWTGQSSPESRVQSPESKTLASPNPRPLIPSLPAATRLPISPNASVQ